MRVLVTGDRGYIGPILVGKLIDMGHEVVGVDTHFFSESIIKNHVLPYEQLIKDIRDITVEDLRSFDGIIHLAGLSNDPLGELNPTITGEINHRASVKLALNAKTAGVKRFVYASSQSLYGISTVNVELDEDNSDKAPITEYAIAKWRAEQDILPMSCPEFIVTCFRPATVFGASPNFRSDVVFNNMMACAFLTGKIEVKSDGTPLRPVVHIEDVSDAFIAGLLAEPNIVSGRSFNVGILDGNFSVRQIAEAVQRSVPGSDLVFTGEHTDSRSYKVSFERIHTELKHLYKPKWNLEKGGDQLLKFFKDTNFTETHFTGRSTNRLAQIRYLIDLGTLSSDLRAI